MSDLLLRAELEKLAVTLNTSVAELGFLSHLDLSALREMRNAMSASLFDRHVKRFQKLADSTKLLPNKLVAIISEKVIPPALSAQITGLLEPAAAVDLARRLNEKYQADICVAMDPRRAAPVLQAMPVDNVIRVAMELLKRREFMTMARFVDDLTDTQIRAVSERMSAEGLLRVGFFVEQDARLDQLISMLSAEQIEQTLPAAAADEGALWPEVLSLVARLGKAQRNQLAGLLSSATPQLLDSLNQALFERDLWRDGIPLLNSLDAAAQEVVATSLASHAASLTGGLPSGLLDSLNDSLRSKLTAALS